MSLVFRQRVKAMAKRVVTRFPWLRPFALKARDVLRRPARARQAQLYKAGVYRALADALEQQGRLSEAVPMLARAASFEPGPALDTRQRLGDMHLSLGQVSEAMRQYQLVLEASGYDDSRVIQIGHFTATAGYLDEAVKIYADAIPHSRKRVRHAKLDDIDVQVLPHYWVDRIGHLAFLDAYVKMSLLGWSPPRHALLLAPAHLVANPAYLDYWRTYLPVISEPTTIEKLEPLVHIIEDTYMTAYVGPSGKPCWWLKAAWAAQEQWEAEGRPPLLHLSDRDRDRGARVLRDLGVPSDAWIVCIHARESGFHAAKPGYPVQTYRDSDISRYDLAIKSIVARGGWVFRMGDKLTPPLEPTAGVIDYAHNDAKSDWMDVFLCASCRFFIATNSGLGIVPSTFGVPAVAIDYTPLANELFVKNGCFIPKLYWWEPEKRYLTFREAMTPPLGYSHRGEPFAAFEIRDNSPQEIRDVVEEMMARLDGTFRETAEEQQLAKRFERLKQERGIVSRAKIGLRFLVQHADLLEVDDGKQVPSVSAFAATAAMLGVPASDTDSALQIGKAFLRIGALDLSAASLREVLRNDPHNAEARSLLATVFRKQHTGGAFASSGHAIPPQISRPSVAVDSEAWRAEMPAVVLRY